MRRAATRCFVALIHPIWDVRRYRVAQINKLGTIKMNAKHYK